MSTIIIGDKRITVSGNNVSILNNKIYVDGKLVTDNAVTEPVKLIVEGDLINVESEGSVDVTGDIKGNVQASCSIRCNNISGNVNTMGSVHSGDINGSVTAIGSIHRN